MHAQHIRYIHFLSFVVFPFSIPDDASSLCVRVRALCGCWLAFAFDVTKFRIGKMRHKDLLKVNSLCSAHMTRITWTLISSGRTGKMSMEIYSQCVDHRITHSIDANIDTHAHTDRHRYGMIIGKMNPFPSIQHPKILDSNGSTNNGCRLSTRCRQPKNNNTK